MTATIKKHVEQKFPDVVNTILEQMRLNSEVDLWQDLNSFPDLVRDQTNLEHQPHVMIDIETLDLQSSAVVLSIGAVEFDLRKDMELGFIVDGRITPNVRPVTRIRSVFYAELFVPDQKNKGRTIGKGTLGFWKEQKPGLEMFRLLKDNRRDADDINKAILDNLNSRLNKPGMQVWANGTDFDLGILKSLYRDYNQTFGVPFFSQRDARTMYNMAHMIDSRVPKNKDYPTNICLHHALADAVQQVLKLQTLYHILSGKPLNLGETTSVDEF